MKTEAEIRERIQITTLGFAHVLEAGPASLDVNGPRAVMQIAAKCELDMLYWVLGETRPTYPCDDQKRKNS